jgi:hypothetical protein
MEGMSTVDPAATRRRAEAEPPRRRGAGGWVGLVLVAACWALFGFGLADALRYPLATSYLAPSDYPPNDLPAFLWALFVGVILGVIVGSAVKRGATIAAFVGMPVGMVFGAAESWVRPAEIGSTMQGEQWGAEAWIGWTSQYWLPGILLLVAVLIAVGGVRVRLARAEQAAGLQRQLANGMRTEAVVSEVTSTGVTVGNRAVVSFTVAFADPRRIERWVTKIAEFDPARLPRKDDPAVVWFDASNPDDLSIPVALGSMEAVRTGLADGSLTVH